MVYYLELYIHLLSLPQISSHHGCDLRLVDALYIILGNRQSVTVIWGWVFMTTVSICIAASMAEICADYPTAGGPYF